MSSDASGRTHVDIRYHAWHRSRQDSGSSSPTTRSRGKKSLGSTPMSFAIASIIVLKIFSRKSISVAIESSYLIYPENHWLLLVRNASKYSRRSSHRSFRQFRRTSMHTNAENTVIRGLLRVEGGGRPSLPVKNTRPFKKSYRKG